jgi:hypothetical protein
MPYEMHWESNTGLRKRFYGLLTIEDVMKSSIELHCDHRFDTLKFSINDFSEVSAFTLDVDKSALDDLAAASIGASLSKPKFHIAIVTTDARLSELAHKYMAAPGSSWTVEVFRTLEAARRWVSEATTSGWAPLGKY